MSAHNGVREHETRGLIVSWADVVRTNGQAKHIAPDGPRIKFYCATWINHDVAKTGTDTVR